MSDLIERLNEPEICDGCKGSGQTATGYTGGESDGNAPELETCGTCGGPGSYVSDLHRDAAAELSRLTAEVERTYDQAYSDGRSMILHEFKTVCDQRDKLTAELARLRGEAEALRADAERYLFFRSKMMFTGRAWGVFVEPMADQVFCVPATKESRKQNDAIDAAIDVARASDAIKEAGNG